MDTQADGDILRPIILLLHARVAASLSTIFIKGSLEPSSQDLLGAYLAEASMKEAATRRFLAPR